MGLGQDIASGLKRLFLLDGRVSTMEQDMKAMETAFLDHEKRLIRIETMIEMGLQTRQLPRIEDE